MSEKSQERLLEKGEDLKLPKAIEIAQQIELLQNQIEIVKEESQAVKVKAKYQTANKKTYQKNQTKAVQKEMHANQTKTVKVVAKTHNISGIKENVQQKALYAHTVTNQTTGWQYAAKDQ